MFSDDQIAMMIGKWKHYKTDRIRWTRIRNDPLMEGWDLGSEMFAWAYTDKRKGWFGYLKFMAETWGSRLTPELFRNSVDFDFIDWESVTAPEASNEYSYALGEVSAHAESADFEKLHKSSEKMVDSLELLGATATSRTISEYKILDDKYIATLNEKVKRHIAQGWQPYGGVSAAAFGMSPVGGNKYIQAMVKYKK